jgi:two-component system sensor kinase FixL
MNHHFCKPEECSRILGAILERSDDAMIRTDLEGLIIGWSPGASRLYGYSAAEAIGASVALLMAPERLNEFVRILGDIRNGNAVNHHETVRRTKDGRAVTVLLSVLPVVDEETQTVTVLSLARDVTALRASERAHRTSEARWRAIIDSAVDGIIVIDSHGRIESFNAAAEKLFGYTAAEAIGQSVNMLMPPPYRDEHDRYLERYLAGGQARIIGMGRQVTARRRNGEDFPARLAVAEASVDGQARFTGIVHDLTDRIEMERRFREQTALAQIGGMTAIVAHEVRNTLAAVRGTIEVVASKLPANSREAAATARAIDRIDALSDIVKDMALFANLPEPRFKPTDLTQVVTSAVRTVEREPPFAGITIEVTGSAPEIQADAELLRIVVANLLINSAQAMGGTGVIRIALRTAHGRGEIAVIDHGPGVPSETRDKLFTPFFTTKVRGSGLGLATAKRIVEAHGGEIRLEYPSGGGTEAIVELPMSQISAASPIDATSPIANPHIADSQ